MVLEEVTGKVLPRGFASPLSDWGNPLGRWSQEPAENDDIIFKRLWRIYAETWYYYCDDDKEIINTSKVIVGWVWSSMGSSTGAFLGLSGFRTETRIWKVITMIMRMLMVMVMVLKASITLWKYLACISIECATLCFYHPNFVKPSFGEILSFDNIGILFSTTDSYLTQHFPRKSRK